MVLWLSELRCYLQKWLDSKTLHEPGKTVEDGPCVWASDTHMGDPDEMPT